MAERKKAGLPPIPLDPIDLLAGIGPGVELEADDLPAGVAGAETTEPAIITVDELGRQLRSGDPTIRRLIRTPMVKPIATDASDPPLAPRESVHDPDKPGE